MFSLFEYQSEMECCRNRTSSGACFSNNRRFRYALWRRWNEGKIIGFILLNPSTADEEVLDPTLRRCQEYARNWGYSGFEIANIFPLRSTDRSVLIITPDREGEKGRNLAHIGEMAKRCETLILGFGIEANRPELRKTIIELRKSLERNIPNKPVFAIKTTNIGLPGHPLYLRKNEKPFVYTVWPEWTESNQAEN